MTQRTLSLVLTTVLAALGWIAIDRFLMQRPWPLVQRDVAAVVLGFLAMHAVATWAERHTRPGGHEGHDPPG